MDEQTNVENHLLSHLYKLRDKYNNEQISFEEYSKLYDKLYQWIAISQDKTTTYYPSAPEM